MKSAIFDNENASVKPSPLTAEPAVQLDDAVQDVSSRTQLLVIQCSAPNDRHALAEHLTALANTPSDRPSRSSRRVDAYLDLTMHPMHPARSVTHGRMKYWDDLAEGLSEAFAQSHVLAIDAPEHMLDVMPMRLTRFIQWCAQQGKLVVIVVSDTQRILDLDLAPLIVQTDTVLSHNGQELHRFGEMAMAVIAAASTKTSPGEPS
jgi:hypothetical protein